MSFQGKRSKSKKFDSEGGEANKKQKSLYSASYKTKQCEFYKKGSCKLGDSCTYSHDFEIEKSQEICKFYKGGTCLKGKECFYSHDLSKVQCRNKFVLEYCALGEKCRFSHNPFHNKEEFYDFIKENEEFIKSELERNPKLNILPFFNDYLLEKVSKVALESIENKITLEKNSLERNDNSYLNNNSKPTSKKKNKIVLPQQNNTVIPSRKIDLGTISYLPIIDKESYGNYKTQIQNELESMILDFQLNINDECEIETGNENFKSLILDCLKNQKELISYNTYLK